MHSAGAGVRRRMISWRETIGQLPNLRRGLRFRFLGGASSTQDRRTRGHGQTVVRRECSLTKIGLWYVLFLVVLVLAGSNTGNNALYMVIASMIALLAIAWLLSWTNLRLVRLDLQPPHEVFAKSPIEIDLVVTSSGRFRSPRWLALSTHGGEPKVVPGLRGAPRGVASRLERRRSERAPGPASQPRFEIVRQMVWWPARGRHRLSEVRVASLYPLGLFRCVAWIQPARTALVFPQLFEASDVDLEVSATMGETSTRRRGQGPELFGLRPFRTGDDPRSVHWKRSAQIGEMVALEREAEESRRLSLLLDNALSPGAPTHIRQWFEALVSEAATMAVDALERGFEVELVTRTRRVRFGSDRLQRRRLLEALALLGTTELPESADGEPAGLSPLRASDPSAWTVRLALATADDLEHGSGASGPAGPDGAPARPRTARSRGGVA